jgi:DNA repair protein RadA/Sms
MSKKEKIVYFCKSCGYESPKWMGKCTACGEWNSFIEELVSKNTEVEKRKSSAVKAVEAIPVQEITALPNARIDTLDEELNRVLGGGMVYGSVILLGGQPGIGKSTLVLQLALSLPHRILYVSGEESPEQIKMRAERVGVRNQECYIYSETATGEIIKKAKELVPTLMIVDSIQTIFSSYLDSPAGSISQIRECTAELQRFAKEHDTPVIIIGHITKDGSIAGPKLLEHIVDVVLQFEGEQNYAYRVLRTIKNRFGSTADLGIYEMKQEGLLPVKNPSQIMLSQSEEELSGSAVAVSMEGVRPLLLETQALVTSSVYGTPQRSATGFDLRRLSMLLAVLEKRCGLGMGANDVFLNIVGGIKVTDPAIDLAVVAALISSMQDISISSKICFTGEVGLSGEIRSVARIEQRVQEAERLGFEVIYLSKINARSLQQKEYQIEIRSISKLEDLLNEVFA